jgi:hypothetical protein
MGAGGIIQKHVAALLPAVNDASFFGQMDSSQQAAVTAINEKAELDYDENDRATLVEIINAVTEDD